MAEIIPAVNEATWEGVKAKIGQIAPYTEWVKIDVSDGRFASTNTWNNPSDLKTLQTSKYIHIEVHLMVEKPEKVVLSWVKAGVRRVIVHYEALKPKGLAGFLGGIETGKKIKALADQCHENWVEFGLAIIWSTPVRAIKRYLALVDMVQVLAVDPGPSGQAFHEEALARVAELRSLQGKFKIEWDGGVTLENIHDIKNAGADIIAAASAIFHSAEPEKSLDALKRELLG